MHPQFLIRWYKVVTSWVTRIGAVNLLGSTSFKVPITYHLCDFLIVYHRWISCKPCVLQLTLAMCKARVYEHPCLWFAFNLFPRCQHCTSQALEGCNLGCSACTRIHLTAAPLPPWIRWRGHENVMELIHVISWIQDEIRGSDVWKCILWEKTLHG